MMYIMYICVCICIWVCTLTGHWTHQTTHSTWQEREELQREGDQLNRDIRKAEKEIRMLSKTLAHLTDRNQNYRSSFNKADMAGDDAKLKADLEDQQRAMADSLYKKKSYLRELTHDFEERKRILNELVRACVGVCFAGLKRGTWEAWDMSVCFG